MPRELRPELEALIATGNCNWATTVDLVLTGDVELHFCSCELFVNRFDVVARQYLARLKDIQPLDMSLGAEVDHLLFSAANDDMVIGRTLTGSERRLDGARATAGTIFIDPDDTDISAGQHIYDAKLPGELTSSEVVDAAVSFELLSDVDAVTISGRTIASEFQWREPISNVPTADPNDIPLPVGGGGFGGGRGGRYGDINPGGPVLISTE